MKPDIKNKIAAEAQTTNIFDELPDEICGFTLKKIFAENGDRFDYFSYEDEKIHRGLTVYFHEETFEYKTRVKIGLNEFCLTKFFTGNFETFGKMLPEILKVVENLSKPINPDEDIFISDRRFSAWSYVKNLPQSIDGFELFITPDKPAKFTNGSYIILSYTNFEMNADFNIFYNIYTGGFSGESKINGVPHVTYLFDAKTLKELQKNLDAHLVAEICRIKNF